MFPYLVRKLMHLVFLLALCFLVNAGVQGQGPPTGNVQGKKDLLGSLLRQYSRESAKLKPEDSKKFFRFWEEQFRHALESNQGSPALVRLRIIEELGALQGNIGEAGRAMETFRQLETEAQAAGDLASVQSALENQLSRSRGEKFEERAAIAQRIESLFVDQLFKDKNIMGNEDQRNALLGYFAEAQYEIALLYQQEGLSIQSGRQGEDRDAAKDLLAKAEKCFETAIELGDVGAIPLELRLFHLGKSQTAMGKKDEAAAAYQRLIDMDQQSLSKVWMGELKIEQLTAKDSPEYREELARMLEEFDSSGAVDDYALRLKMQLAMSYHGAGEYEESNRWANQIVGGFEDDERNSQALELVAANFEALGQLKLAEDMRREIISRYPKSSSASVASNVLERAASSEKLRKRVEEERTEWAPQTAQDAKRSGVRLLIIITNAVVVTGLAIWLIRRLRRRSR